VVPCQRQVPDRDLLVGVALSGGGSRAALFGAAGLESLARIRMNDGTSLIEHVTHISSVSGGSLAAIYYALRKPDHTVKVLNADGTMSDAYRGFFNQYRALLTQDFESTLIRRQLLSFRWINSALAAKTLAEVLRDKLYGDAKMQDVVDRERAGDAPGLIVNTTLYNNGRRLALTALPGQAFQYEFLDELRRSVQRQGQSMEPIPEITAQWHKLRPMTPVDIGMDPCPMRLNGMAAASASFPPLVGPITMRVDGQNVYWHAGDGGLYENSGVESLVFLFLRQLQMGHAKRALIITLDSSYPFSVGERRLSARSLPFSLLTFDFSRIPSIMEERAGAYAALFFRSLQLEGVMPDSKTITAFNLRHTAATWAPDLSDLPASCKAEASPPTTPQAVTERIAEIPTRLGLKSACDRDLLAAAAAKLVEDNRGRILEFVNRTTTAGAGN
jgi:patatin-like phospholipase